MRQKINTLQQKPDIIQTTLTSGQTIGATGTIILFDTTVFSSGSRLTRSANTVVIGTGVTKVRVTYTLMAESAGTAGYLFARIRKNTSEVSQVIDNSGSSAFKCVTESKIITVVAGDTITIIADSGSGTFVLPTNRSSFLQVEVIE